MAQYPKRRDIGRHGLAGTPAKSNLEQFKSQFATSDLARTERFECEFHFPSGIYTYIPYTSFDHSRFHLNLFR